MVIVIPDDYQGATRHLGCLSLLQGHEVRVIQARAQSEEELAECLVEADALVLIRERTRVTASLLNRLPRLRVISQTGRAGTHIDVSACQARGITILEGKGSPIAPAELCWALILAASRRLPAYMSSLQGGCWQDTGDPHLGRVLHGRKLGIYGLGKIGERMASYGQAFGMKVWVWGREASREAARNQGYMFAPSREAFFAESDVLSLHVRLTTDTRGIITAADLDLMKPDALLVNISRAELIQPGVLVEAIRRGRPGQAAVDVFEQEPPSSDDPLLHTPNIVATPHLGYVERDSYEMYFRVAFENLLRFWG